MDLLPGSDVTAERVRLTLPPRMDLQTWSDLGRKIHMIADSSGWWLGDWLVYGEATFPDRYLSAIEGTGLNYQTLRNYAWIARRFPPGRRHGDLSIQHHMEVAALESEAQDLWLDRAERFKWSRNLLRNKLRAARAAHEQLVRESRVSLSVESERKERWTDAAAKADCAFEAWVATVLDRAAAAELDGITDRA